MSLELISITKTCRMYNQGDKGETNRSVNIMVSNQVTAQMAAIAIEQCNDDLKENQCKIADALNQLASDSLIGGEGGTYPIIDSR